MLLGGMLAVMSFLSYVQGGGLSQAQQVLLFMFFVWGAGAFFTSTMLAQFGEGSRAALALTLPASQFEKYLLAWLFSLPIFLLVFTAEFYLADWLVLSLNGGTSAVINLVANAEQLLDALATLLVLHGVALWGSIYYRRQQFIRTGFLGFGVVMGGFVLNYQVIKALIGKQVLMATPFGVVQLPDYLRLTLPERQDQWVGLLPLVLAGLLWLAAYARLTEKQL